MRQRDRFANAVWLARFVSQGESGGTASLRGASGDTVESALGDLARLGYVITLEASHGVYKVRCLVDRRTAPLLKPHVSLSYIGDDLRSIAAAAVFEAVQLDIAHEAYIPSATEVQRWVAP